MMNRKKWKEMVMAYFSIVPSHFLAITKKSHEILQSRKAVFLSAFELGNR
jgi:hypothetical protein